jgi:putative aminopeptidase FrvX
MAKAAKKTSEQKVGSVLTTQSLQFFKEYINNPSPVGFESSGQKMWLQYLRPFIDEEFTDPYGTAVGVINPNQPFKVVIEAHADEISWFVNYVTNEGLNLSKKKWRR